ncbi:ABC transporter ATP-binding protein [Microbacterium sp. No. 7]|uniref:ABC transporter ATP-binding protein n=1 Tax=Microbacterium sp. No. 7 TaxID=1714373 RepID=UPI0006D2A731|nr:ABC transporter ATP-binding protein [Microbacterium sp. No. 7]ALJ21642.1 iron ABC transporter permease [Microbacterium sp. No. 7]
MIRTLLSLLPADRRGRVVLHTVLALVSVVVRAASIVVLVPVITALFGPVPADAWPWVGVFAALTAAGWALDGVASAIGFELGFGLLDTGQHAVADQLTRVRLTWFDADNTSNARQAIAATGPELVGLVIYLVTPLVSAVALPVAIAIALLPIAWQLGVAALLGVPVLLGAYVLAGRIGRAADRAASDANAALTERIVEFARTQQALRAARRVDPERSHVGAALARQHGAMMRLLLMQVPGQLVFSVASQLALLLLAGTTVVLAADGQVSVPAAIALIVVIVRYLEPFTTLAELSGGVEASLGTLRRIRSVLEAPRTPSGTRELGGSRTADAGPGSTATATDGRDAGAVPESAGTRAPGAEPGSAGPRDAAPGAPARIELRDVTFGYAAGETPVLDRLTLTLEPGSTTAIVGPSGSGKSTVLALLAGLHAPTSGTILVDGQDAAELTADARAGLVSVVFQHPYLFDGTIRENIAVGDPSADAETLEDAARLARVDAVAARLPDGFGARVGEAGSSLSGGERQRVSIARALLKPAPLLLVDEATSALDTENEVAVASALADDRIARTRVIVAHRLSSIRAAERVVFLEDGRVVEDGTIDELLSAGGRFAEFWRQQEAATGWGLGAAARA